MDYFVHSSDNIFLEALDTNNFKSKLSLFKCVSFRISSSDILMDAEIFKIKVEREFNCSAYLFKMDCDKAIVNTLSYEINGNGQIKGNTIIKGNTLYLENNRFIINTITANLNSEYLNLINTAIDIKCLDINIDCDDSLVLSSESILIQTKQDVLNANTSIINSNTYLLNSKDVITNTTAFLLNTNTANVVSNYYQLNSKDVVTNSNTFILKTNTANIISNIYQLDSTNVITNSSAFILKANTTNINSNISQFNSNIFLLNSNIVNIVNNKFQLNSNDTIFNSNILLFNTNVANIISNNLHFKSNLYQVDSTDLSINSNTYRLNTTIGNVVSNNLHFKSNMYQLDSKNIIINSDNYFLNANIANITIYDMNQNSNIYTLTSTITNINSSNNVNINSNVTDIKSNTIIIKTDNIDLTGNLITRGMVLVDNINPIGSTFSLGSNTNVKAINIGTGNNLQTINIGTTNTSTINIGKFGSIININGNIFNVEYKNLQVDNKNIFLNGNAEGITAQGAGIYIRDANDDRKAYILIDDDGKGYVLKAPQSGNVIHIDNSQFNRSGFVRTTYTDAVDGGLSDLIASAIQISDITGLVENLDGKFDISGGTIEGNVILNSDLVLNPINTVGGRIRSNDGFVRIVSNVDVLSNLKVNRILTSANITSTNGLVYITGNLEISSNVNINDKLIVSNITSRNGLVRINANVSTNKLIQGSGDSLEIGEAGNALKILGAITKGSILVGSMLNTVECALGLNNQVLAVDLSEPNGIRWRDEKSEVSVSQAPLGNTSNKYYPVLSANIGDQSLVIQRSGNISTSVLIDTSSSQFTFGPTQTLQRANITSNFTIPYSIHSGNIVRIADASFISPYNYPNISVYANVNNNSTPGISNIQLFNVTTNTLWDTTGGNQTILPTNNMIVAGYFTISNADDSKYVGRSITAYFNRSEGYNVYIKVNYIHSSESFVVYQSISVYIPNDSTNVNEPYIFEMNSSNSTINYSRNYPVLRAGSYNYQILPMTGGTSLGYWYRGGSIPTSIFKVSPIFATSVNTTISPHPNYPLTTFSFPANIPIPIPEKFQIKLNYLNDTNSPEQTMNVLGTNSLNSYEPGGFFYPNCIIKYDTGSNNQPYFYDIGTDTLSLLNLLTTGKLTVDTIEPIEQTLSFGSKATAIHIGTGTPGTINIGGVGSVVNINGNINYVGGTRNLEVDYQKLVDKARIAELEQKVVQQQETINQILSRLEMAGL